MTAIISWLIRFKKEKGPGAIEVMAITTDTTDHLQKRQNDHDQKQHLGMRLK